MKLEEIQAYNMAMETAEKIWNLIIQWDFFEKETVGKQLMYAVDSIATNLSNGLGRFYYKENKRSCYYSQGALFEARTWLIKAHNRSLINDTDFNNLLADLDAIASELNNYIKTIGPPKKK